MSRQEEEDEQEEGKLGPVSEWGYEAEENGMEPPPMAGWLDVRAFIASIGVASKRGMGLGTGNVWQERRGGRAVWKADPFQ